MPGRFEGKIGLITGASRGIGRATAEALAREGAHVILLGREGAVLRSVDDAIQKEGGEATLTPLDLRDGAGIDRLGAAIFERWGRLDILVGNAALLGSLSPAGHIDPALWEEVLSVNLTSSWRLIRAMDPLLKKAPHGRAVFLTSAEARAKKPFMSAYASSKAGLEALIAIWARESEKTPLKINLYDPVAAATMMRRALFPGEDPKSVPKPQEVVPALLELLLEDCTRHGEIVSFATP